MLVSTTPKIEGKKIVEYLALVSSCVHYNDLKGYRNGHRDKVLKSRVGELTLTCLCRARHGRQVVPRLRRGHFSTELFERYKSKRYGLQG